MNEKLVCVKTILMNEKLVWAKTLLMNEKLVCVRKTVCKTFNE